MKKKQTRREKFLGEMERIVRAVKQLHAGRRAAGRLSISVEPYGARARGADRLGLVDAHDPQRVSLTEAGERLLSSIEPRFQEIEAELDSLRAMTDRPSGTVRITTTD
jgi:hypothetical protein